jgi:hypothetical protein
VKLWIIYKGGLGFSKFIAELLQDRLEDYIDVSAGNIKMIDPSFLVEERLDYLIIGDTISKATPNLEIQNWLLKFWEISKNKNLIVKAISGFYIIPSDIKIEPIWVEFLQDNLTIEMIYPPILRLKLMQADVALENGALEIIKDYTNDFVKNLLIT